MLGPANLQDRIFFSFIVAARALCVVPEDQVPGRCFAWFLIYRRGSISGNYHAKHQDHALQPGYFFLDFH
jgi:hypothetical protein